MLQRVLGWLAVLFIVIWIVVNPAHAGDTIHSWATGIVTFFTHASH